MSGRASVLFEYLDKNLFNIINYDTIKDRETTVLEALHNIGKVEQNSTSILKLLEDLDEEADRQVVSETIICK